MPDDEPREDAASSPEVTAPAAGDDVRDQRDLIIITSKLRGLPWHQIANSAGLGERRCKQIFKAWRDSNPPLRSREPLDIVDELLEQYQGGVEELAMLSATAKNDSARVGAVRARMDTLQRIAELLQATGVLPNDLGQLRVSIDVSYVTDVLVEIFTRYKVPDEAIDEVVKALNSGTNADAARAVAGSN